MSNNDEPKLAAPGAGLPAPELYIARLLFGLRRLTGSRDSFNRHFLRERAGIRGLVDSCDAESLATRVLIRRAPGLEDSSRYWSVLMTLDHLRIVNVQLVRVIETLGKGISPEGRASTASVKPDPGVTSSVIGEYEISCDALLARAAAISDLKTKARFAHPWFGAMDASGWHAMAGAHMGIHRVQIERIINGL